MNENNYPGSVPQPSPFPGEPNQPPVPPISEPAPQVPPPPSTESQVGVRTMGGDMSSLNSSGGGIEQPKTFRPKDLIGGEPVFQPKSATEAAPTPAQDKTKHTKTLILAAVGAIAAIGLAVAGFIFVPKLLQKPVVPEVTAVLSANPTAIDRGQSSTLTWQTANATDVSIDGIGAVELSGSREVNPSETTTYRLVAKGGEMIKEASVEVTVNDVVVPPPFQHQSMFPAASSVGSISVMMSVPSPAGFNAALKTGLAAETTLPVFKEVLPQDSASAAIGGYSFLPLFMPSLTKEYLTATIAEDFTAFVYKDKDGVWPGYVVKLNRNVPPPTTDASGNPIQAPAVTADATELLAAIKQLPTVFYVEDPGAPKAAKFNDGAKFNPKIQSVQYLAYTKAGASFNVATLKNGDDSYVIWSTSFNGIKEVIKLMGF